MPQIVFTSPHIRIVIVTVMHLTLSGCAGCLEGLSPECREQIDGCLKACEQVQPVRDRPPNQIGNTSYYSPGGDSRTACERRCHAQCYTRDSTSDSELQK